MFWADLSFPAVRDATPAPQDSPWERDPFSRRDPFGREKSLRHEG